ncbi:hypothetical protein O6H91_Y438400 [Diphasiastrum complanatum]|nr:hypothetical protein O6H91_Y438400 [Diphasiastrum complanatum]
METALYLEDFKAREYVLTVFMDVIYMHHHALKFEEIEHLLVPFLYSSTAKMQYAAVIGNGRLLLYNCFPEETEYLLSAMFERYVYEIPPQCSSLNESLEPVLKAMHIFFQDYSGGKDLHQDEIANTLVFMCLKKLDEGVVLINELRNLMHDSPNKKTEARKLRLAVRFGLSLCDNGLETVMASLAININSRFNNVMLLKEDCLSWFLLN